MLHHGVAIITLELLIQALLDMNGIIIPNVLQEFLSVFDKLHHCQIALIIFILLAMPCWLPNDRTVRQS